MKIKILIIGIIFIGLFSFIPTKYEIYAKKANKTTNSFHDISQKDNIVFLGDSITDWYPISDIYNNLPIVKSGVAGYETDDILERMDTMVYQYNPTKVFLLIGTNDLKNDDDKTEKTSKKIIKILKQIHKHRPNARLYYEAIFPVNRSLSGAEDRYNDEIKEVNKIVKEYCVKQNITYIDTYRLLEDSDGNFNKSYTNDGLHPNELGYSRISSELLKYIYDIEDWYTLWLYIEINLFYEYNNNIVMEW